MPQKVLKLDFSYSCFDFWASEFYVNLGESLNRFHVFVQESYGLSYNHLGG